MFEYKSYDQERARFVHMLDIPNADEKRGIIMLPDNVIETARFVWTILQKRQCHLFS